MATKSRFAKYWQHIIRLFNITLSDQNINHLIGVYLRIIHSHDFERCSCADTFMYLVWKTSSNIGLSINMISAIRLMDAQEFGQYELCYSIHGKCLEFIYTSFSYFDSHRAKTWFGTWSGTRPKGPLIYRYMTIRQTITELKPLTGSLLRKMLALGDDWTSHWAFINTKIIYIFLEFHITNVSWIKCQIIPYCVAGYPALCDPRCQTVPPVSVGIMLSFGIHDRVQYYAELFVTWRIRIKNALIASNPFTQFKTARNSLLSLFDISAYF